MEFKYMIVGTEFYGDQSKFEQQVDEEGEDEQALFIRKKTMQEQGIKDDSNVESKEWHCKNYSDTMDDQGNEDIDKTIKSVGGNENFLM